LTLPSGATQVRPAGGGDINEAFRLVLADGREAFVKTRADPGPGEYAAEAAGLLWLAQPGALRTPEVLEVSERYLALAPIEPGSLSGAGAEDLGRGLALTHAAGAHAFGRHEGAPPGPARLGGLELPNEPAADWPAFYAACRLQPAARMAHRRGALTDRGMAAVERLCGRIEELAGGAEAPARLHGDLWSGNVMADREGRPWLIDPFAHGGHRELDLAMLRLFGGAPEQTFAAYEEAFPLAEGWRERIELYQLFPLLVHAALFGGSYGAAAERAALGCAG
jgi:fructosamine-3-kinase